MDAWVVGLVLVAVIGLAVIAYGAVSDRRRHRRALAEVKAPPKRDIPKFAPDAPAPHYLTDLEAHRPPADAPSLELTVEQRRQTREQLADPATREVPVRRASDHFVTDRETSWSVLDGPRVLVCADPVRSVRELLGVLERMIVGRQPIVIIAPEFTDEVRRTLEVNLIQRRLTIFAGTADAAGRAAAAAATGATPASVDDLRAGYLPDDHLGRCRRWVAEPGRSFVVAG